MLAGWLAMFICSRCCQVSWLCIWLACWVICFTVLPGRFIYVAELRGMFWACELACHNYARWFWFNVGLALRHAVPAARDVCILLLLGVAHFTCFRCMGPRWLSRLQLHSAGVAHITRLGAWARGGRLGFRLHSGLVIPPWL